MAGSVSRLSRLVLLSLGMLLSACGASNPSSSTPASGPTTASASPKQGGTLTFAIDRDLVLMNPLVSTSSNDKWLRELMFEPLLGIDLKGDIQPNLAESWSVSSDGQAYTFRLRKGVTFHSGQEMTADDVRFSIDYTLNPQNGAYGFSTLKIVDSVETPDKYSVVIHLKSTSAEFAPSLTSIQSFSVVPKGSLEEGLKQPKAFPPGTGPFKFGEWQPSQRIVLDRFDGYWGHKALLDKVVLRPVPDETVRLTALRAGDVDMIVRAPLSTASQLVKREFPGLSYSETPQGALYRIQFNVADPPFNNKKLRQAVAYAIDKQEILNAAFFGLAQTTDQKYPKGHSWYIDGVPSPSLGLDKARALLREAGYKGEPITMISDQQETSRTAAVTIQSQLKKIGVEVQIQPLEVAAYNDRTGKGEFAFRWSGANPGYPDPATSYVPDLVCEPDIHHRISNEPGYCDQEMDRLLQQVKTELDQTKRKALFKQILTKMNDDLPDFYIGFSSRFFAYRDFVKDFTTSGDGTFRWWGGGLNYAWLAK